MGSISDLLTKVGQPGSATTLSSPGKAIGATSINVGSTSNWPAVGEKVYFAMRTVNPSLISFTSSNYNPSGLVTGTYTEWMGIVGTNTITNLQIVSGSDQVYNAGTNSQVFIPVLAARENALVTWGLAQHNQDGSHSNITATNVTTTALTAGSINTTAANGINQAALPLGTCVQVAGNIVTAVATGTTIIPLDDTIPQITEGNQYLSQAITPKATTNILVIEVGLYAAPNTADNIQVAIFQDSTANAIAAMSTFQGANAAGTSVYFTYRMPAGTTSATTFSVRAGCNSANTLTVNGSGGTRRLGGVMSSSITIREYKA